MGDIVYPPGVKLICGLLYTPATKLDEVRAVLEERWGKIEDVSAPLPFVYTDYYDREMGTPIYRRFLSFAELVDRERLVACKLESNDVEKQFEAKGKRTVNIDPGYLTLGQLILVTTKDREHRVYLGKGIFAEVTLWYSQKTFQTFPWTYRDYATSEYHEILLRFRKAYRRQLR